MSTENDAWSERAVREGARRAAARLNAEHNIDLFTGVEHALAARAASQRSGQFVLDPVSLGGLVVSIATLAYTVYQDLRKRSPRPSAEVVERSVRLELTSPREFDGASQDAVIRVTVEETVRAAASGAES